MTSFTENHCPLCSEVFPSEQLHAHIASEHPLLRRSTIQVIRAYHPGWLEEQGACGPCWRSYREAGRILNVLREAKRRDGGWNTDYTPRLVGSRTAGRERRLGTY